VFGGKKARNLPKMYWDAELEESAKNYSRLCTWAHSSDTEHGTLPYDYGENNYAISIKEMGINDFINAVDRFGEEVEEGYDPETGLPPTHYGQVVWENSVRVGCGVTSCWDSGIIGLAWSGSFFVCQYYEPGNWYGTYGDDEENNYLIPYTYTDIDEYPGIGCVEGRYGNSTRLDDTWTALCNNVNSICGDDNRCFSADKCIPGGNLNGEYTSYSCILGLCEFVEYNDQEINIVYGQNLAIKYCQYDLQNCMNLCFDAIYDGEDACVGVTSGYHLNLVVSSDEPLFWTVRAFDDDDVLHEAGGFYYELYCNTAPPTVSPTACTEYNYWTPSVAESNCPESTWGSTNKGYGTALACTNSLQDRLEESLANGLFQHCSAWCVYDLKDLALSGYIWKSGLGCWQEVTAFTCYSGNNIAIQETFAAFAPTICDPAPTSPPTVSLQPSSSPTMPPSSNPTTLAPTLSPTLLPTDRPSIYPSVRPSTSPSKGPVEIPTFYPTWSPTRSPSEKPTLFPTSSPLITNYPSITPTTSPTKSPMLPSLMPSFTPTVAPTRMPTDEPSGTFFYDVCTCLDGRTGRRSEELNCECDLVDVDGLVCDKNIEGSLGYTMQTSFQIAENACWLLVMPYGVIRVKVSFQGNMATWVKYLDEGCISPSTRSWVTEENTCYKFLDDSTFALPTPAPTSAPAAQNCSTEEEYCVSEDICCLSSYECIATVGCIPYCDWEEELRPAIIEVALEVGMSVQVQSHCYHLWQQMDSNIPVTASEICECFTPTYFSQSWSDENLNCYVEDIGYGLFVYAQCVAYHSRKRLTVPTCVDHIATSLACTQFNFCTCDLWFCDVLSSGLSLRTACPMTCGGTRADSDGDGVDDCDDECPYDSAKTTSGYCGCGFPETDMNSNNVSDCFEVDFAYTLRWSLPSTAPTSGPTNMMTTAPTTSPPTTAPTDAQTNQPSTNSPTSQESFIPTQQPTAVVFPTSDPTNHPTPSPTKQPTSDPTDITTTKPSSAPTNPLTPDPTNLPTFNPSFKPTSWFSTPDPTSWPTLNPSLPPTTHQPTVNPTSSTITVDPTSTPVVIPTDVPSLQLITNSPTNIPSNQPTSYPTHKPSLAPTMSPTSSPTNSPTDDSSWCIPLQEWSESRSDETCPGDAKHRYGVQVCDTYLNEDYSSRLDIALANELYSSCSHVCLYDYETYQSSQPYAFKYQTSDDCYIVVTGWYCIEDAVEAMQNAHAHAALLCDLPEEPCEERREWSQETSDYWCPNGDGGAEKGYGTASVCGDLERLYNGYFELTSVLYQESFEKSLANHMYRSCISTCVYDIVYETEVGYIWKEARGCWQKVTGWTCYEQQVSELLEVQDRLENDLCREPTPAPISLECTPRVQSWNDEIAAMSCAEEYMGWTNKTAKAVVCEGYEEHQYRLDHSLANRVFPSCSAWCVYDIFTRAYEAFLWKNDLRCWKLVTEGFCLEHKSNDRMIMTDWIDNQLCPSDTLEPTYQPTCTPQQEYSDELMDEYCSVEDSALTYKHYNGVLDESGTAVDRAAVACTELNGEDSGVQDTFDLKKSLANKLYEGCSAWCVFDWYTEAIEVWKWSNSNKCWTRMTTGSCIYDYNAQEYLQIWYDMQEKISTTCTYSPTLSPTSCYPEYEWSQERANEVCTSENYGSTDRSFEGAVVCTDNNSVGRQAQLEKTLANEFYVSCSSWCLYDWETLINDIDGVGGFIWKNSCWKWVTGFTCFESSADEYEEVRNFAMGTCAYEATL